MEEEDRIRLPKGNEVIGIVEEKLGGARFRVLCQDDLVRLCRVPGRLKRSMWIDLNNIVIVEPWELQPKERGDIVYKYSQPEIEILRKKGIIKF